MNFGRVTDQDTIRFERVLPGTAEAVWDFLTDPKQLALWLASARFEKRVGGLVELHWTLYETQDGCQPDTMNCGTILRYDPPHLLSFTWQEIPTNPVAPVYLGPPSVVTFELKKHGSDVLLVLTHRRLAANDLAGTAAGWHVLLDILERRMVGEPAGDFVAQFRRALAVYTGLARGTPPDEVSH